MVLCAVAVGIILLAAQSPTSTLAGDRRLWAARYNGPANLDDSAAAVTVSPDGSRVYVTGYSQTLDYYYDYATAAYDASTGHRLWVARYDGPVSSTDAARAIGVSPDGSRVYVTGESWGRGDDYDYATIAYDAATGQRLWVARYDGPAVRGHDIPNALAVNPDGSAVYVTGYSESVSDADYATVAYDASTGERLWVARYSGPAGDGDNAKSLAVSPNGSAVYVTGLSPGTSSLDYATVAYAASTGARLWVARYDGPAHLSDGATSVRVNPGGSTVYVTGQSARATFFFDYATVAYDAATGAQRWVSRYNGPGDRDDSAWSLAVSPDGSKLFVTGESVGSGTGFDYATVAYRASTGKRLWVARYNGGGDDQARAVAINPEGTMLFVTGSSYPRGTRDYATLAYRASTGEKSWTALYNGPANDWDQANALAVNPDGSAVYVTGESEGTTNPLAPLDYATIAYRAAP